jgi:hypothetical protein
MKHAEGVASPPGTRCASFLLEFDALRNSQMMQFSIYIEFGTNLAPIVIGYEIGE